MKVKMRFFLTLTLIVMTLSGAIAAQPGPQPGDFDNYVFSLSWQPAFCESHQDKKECNSWKSGDFDTQNLVLHGLWPNKNNDKKHNYGYCNVSFEIRNQDNADTWCQMPDLQLAEETIDKLNMVMPGHQSCLQNHEWYRHGTCSEMEPDEYFSTAARFVESFATTQLGALLSANVGKRLMFSKLILAAQEDYDDKAANLRFICQNGMLSEVRMYLNKELPKDGGITAAMLVNPGDKERTSCSGNILIDQFSDDSQHQKPVNKKKKRNK
jgi:ribonuclease T2